MDAEDIKKILIFSNIILGLSGIIDLILYLFYNFHVPSFVVTAFSISFILYNIVLMRMLAKS